MNVCILMPVLDPFKGGNHLPLFAACKNTAFTIVCNRSKIHDHELPPNVTVEVIPARIGSYYYGIADALFARSVLKKYPASSSFWKQFDVLHLNQVMGPALRKLSRTGVPTLFLIHHPVTADREIAMSQSKGFSTIHWWLKYWLLVHWQKRMCGVVDRVVTVSKTMQKRIAENYHCSTNRISVVENGVDGSRFAHLPDVDCSFDVIAIGSFVHPRKGFAYLLEVYRQLAQAGYRIADVGRRNDEQRASLAGINGVSLFGTVDEQQLTELVQHSRVLVSSSLFEGFGLSLIEALACGKPAFAFAVGAVPEVLGAIDSSLVIPTKDTGEMVQAVKSYLALSSEQRDEKGQHYRNMVLSRYSLSQSADALESLYRDMTS